MIVIVVGNDQARIFYVVAAAGLIHTVKVLGAVAFMVATVEGNTKDEVGIRSYALDDPCVYEETILHIECAGHDFTAKGKRVVQMGWKRIWCAFRGSIGASADEKDEDNPLTIPEKMTEGFEFPFPKAAIREGKTTPPTHHTEDICCERGIRNHP